MKIPENLIDVLSDESFAMERIPGAKNICVYEVAFLEKVSMAFPDRETSLTLYGLSPRTHEAEKAATILKAAGYSNVRVLEGGLEGWKSRGGATDGIDSPTGSWDGLYSLIPSESLIVWTGRNFFNFYSGELLTSGGEIMVNGGIATGGHIAINMESMRCSDIADSAMNQLLINHLRNDDFFAVDRFPEARLTITSSRLISGATPGQPNLHFDTLLTLREHTHPLEFDVVGARRQDGALVAQGSMQFDRTLWGSLYGSGRFFAGLGKHVVNDLIDLQIKIVASPA